MVYTACLVLYFEKCLMIGRTFTFFCYWIPTQHKSRFLTPKNSILKGITESDLNDFIGTLRHGGDICNMSFKKIYTCKLCQVFLFNSQNNITIIHLLEGPVVI